MSISYSPHYDGSRGINSITGYQTTKNIAKITFMFILFEQHGYFRQVIFIILLIIIYRSNKNRCYKIISHQRPADWLEGPKYFMKLNV